MKTKYIEGIGMVEITETPEEAEAVKKQEPQKVQQAAHPVEYVEGQDGILYPKIAPDENPELEKMPVGIFANEAVKFLTENYPERVQQLKIQGIWFSTLYKIDNQALEMMETVQTQLKQKNPVPPTDNFMELVNYNNWIRETAQEIVLNEVVRIPV